MGRDDIVKRASARTGVHPQQVRAVLDAILDVKADALVSGEDLRLDEFGTYRLVRNPPRRAHDFQTGERIVLAESTSIRFKPARRLGDRLNSFRRGAATMRQPAK